jgi:AbrB family looped-hinge helix DNA binding protein
MSPNSTIGSKGRITLPIEIRRRLGVTKGDRVEFVAEGEHTFIRPAQPADNPSRNMQERFLPFAPGGRSMPG